MKPCSAELAYIRRKGLYITEKCDGCGKVLNQSFRYTIAGKPEVYCSAACRDFVFFGDRHEAKKHLTPKKCAYCGGELKGKNRGTLYCGDKCRMRANRTNNSATPKKPNSDCAESTGCRHPAGQLRQSPPRPADSGLKSGHAETLTNLPLREFWCDLFQGPPLNMLTRLPADRLGLYSYPKITESWRRQ